MSEQARHTPTPWKMHSEGGFFWIGADNDALMVAEMRGFGYLSAAAKAAGSNNPALDASNVASANAEFIVRACNAYAVMLEALREILADYDERVAAYGDYESQWKRARAIAAARAALATATGGENE